MSLLEIVQWPDERLGVVCDQVDVVSAKVKELAQDMLETMYAAPGRGLAAPQVGVLSRLFVMDATWKDGDRSPLVFINPEILDQSSETAELAEGCLSIPGVLVDVKRPVRVRLAWTALTGEREECDFDGFEAACVQHELDHLNGVLTLDRVSPEERRRAIARYDGVVG
ncbi:MAG: peptide deformylase [Roseobacter sp.]